jgi:hypothetical protein
VLVARQEIVQEAPGTLQDFVAGWFDAISVMKEDPDGSNRLIGAALKLGPEDVSGMLSGLKLTAWADNAQFFGLTSQKPYFHQLFNSAFIWRKKGVDQGGGRDFRTPASWALADQYRPAGEGGSPSPRTPVSDRASSTEPSIATTNPARSCRAATSP